MNVSSGDPQPIISNIALGPNSIAEPASPLWWMYPEGQIGFSGKGTPIIACQAALICQANNFRLCEEKTDESSYKPMQVERGVLYEMADQRLWQNYEWDFIESSALVSATASRVAEQQSRCARPRLPHSRVDQPLLAPMPREGAGRR